MFKDKAYVCNLCRKVITYSPQEAGQTFPCPFCKSPVTLPKKGSLRVGSERCRKNTWRFCFLSVIALIACGTGLTVYLVANDAIPGLTREHVIIAPAPARVRGAPVSVTVTDVWYGCPDIHNATLNKEERAQTPVCCVTLAISNTGKEGAGYRSWREPVRLAGQAAAVLIEAGGATNSLVSFGSGCSPAGMRQQAEIAPDTTVNDTLFFLCAKKPGADLELTLPGENAGGKGHIRFQIPRAMVR
jgi:hypothetical protein